MASLSANAQPQINVTGLAANRQNHQLSHTHPTLMPQVRTSLKTIGDSSELLHPLRPVPFPLPGYDFRLVCSQCFKENSPPLQTIHTCRQDLLIVCNRETPRWRLIREPKNWGNVYSYKVCRSVSAGIECFRGLNCWFAHSQEECQLWNMKKDHSFRQEDFMTSHQSPDLLSRYTVEAVYKKFAGHMGFLCKLCYQQNARTGFQDLSKEYCSTEQHQMRSSRVLAHYDNTTCSFTAIGQRSFTKKRSFYNMCRWGRYCRSLRCVFAHSIIEYDLWYVQKDSNLSEEQILQKWQTLSGGSSTTSGQGNAGQTFSGSAGDQSSYENASVASATLQPPSYNARRASSSAVDVTAARPITKCPLNIMKVCSVCYHSGRKLSKKRATGNHCANGHDWDINKVVYVVVSSKKVIRRLPQRQRGKRSRRKFRMCDRAKKDCRYSSKCVYAHNEEEIKLWTWMEENEVNSLDAIIEMQEERNSSQASSRAAPPIWSTSQAPPAPSAWPTPYQSVQYFCEYCSKYFDSQAHLERHCVTFEHQGNVSSDKDHQWNHRQPPWNVRNGQYRLCSAHLEGKCRFTKVDEKFNYCTFAHSQEQLDEWKERYKWREMKIKAAQMDNLYSYISRLKKEYNGGGCTVLSETVEEVSVECSESLSIVDESKDKVKEWTFKLQSVRLTLQKVVLLHEEGALHFILVGDSLEKDCQIADGKEFFNDHTSKYEVTVRFTGGLFGSFRQWVVFDFGQRPKLVQKLTVDLGRLEACDRLLTLRQQLNFDRWTTQNRLIVRFGRIDRSGDEFNGLLLVKYKEPNIDEITMQQIDQSKPNRHNYTHRMHSLIGLEELAQAKAIATESRYDVVTKMYLTDRLEFEWSGIQFSRPGQLFAKVTLENRIIEGSLISSSSVSSVLLCRPGSGPGDVVYEAIITDMADHPLKGSRDIFLTLSEQCCRQLNLRVGQKYDVEVQFQLDRMTFCRMHYAIDQLNSTNIIFPAEAQGSRPSASTMPLLPPTRVSPLNEDQNKILNFVLRRHLSSWPLVVYGPFGTGKTRTLAEAAMFLTSRCCDAYILICTLTNHAADEYILRYFHPLAAERQLSILRVYDKFRFVNRVDPQILGYSLRSGQSTFCEPTVEDIKGKRIVVTTLETSLVIARLEEQGLKGHFTHIFIDEAAQANECRAVMPLCLADESTCVVLAGDHIQMTEPVHSEDARKQNFHVSLVERLISSYINTGPATQNKPMVLLRANYRNHPEIVQFVGKVFYGGDDILKPVKGVHALDVRAFPALIFHAANGRETQQEGSTSFYNEAEVIEVVDQVNRMVNEWPMEWGEPKPEEILITTPYADQVSMIRNSLRNHKNRRLGKVVVLKVQNVPGKEFRSVFISTVRTRHLLDESTSNQELSYGFLSDDKMLNSALTRAKSSVTVVGDPVALCCIGSCSKIWRQYLKHCQQLKSIRPAMVTVESIRLQVNAVMANLSNARAEDNADDAQNDAEQQQQQQVVGGASENEDWNNNSNYRFEQDKTLFQVLNWAALSTQNNF